MYSKGLFCVSLTITHISLRFVHGLHSVALLGIDYVSEGGRACSIDGDFIVSITVRHIFDLFVVCFQVRRAVVCKQDFSKKS